MLFSRSMPSVPSRRARPLAAALALGCLLAMTAAPDAFADSDAMPGCTEAAADWMSAQPVLSRRVAPSDCAVLGNSTPSFFWPYVTGTSRFEWVIERGDGTEARRVVRTSGNWLLTETPLRPGSYRWRISSNAGGETRVSSWRWFQVREDARPMIGSALASWPAQAAAAPRPRSWPRGEALEALRAEAAGARAAGLHELGERVRRHMALALPKEPSPSPVSASAAAASAGAYAEWATWSNATGTELAREEARINDALTAWMLTGNADFWAEALRRVDHLSRWDPEGSTSHASQDQANRAIMRVIAQLVDCGFDRLTLIQRDRFARVVRARWQEPYRQLAGLAGSLTVQPFDSHGVSTLGALASIALLMAGLEPDADEWIGVTVPLYLAMLSPWGGEDGGYANGVAYARHDLALALLNVDVLSGTLGVDLSRHDWFARLGEFMLHMNPPGAQTSAFGDEVELPAGAYSSLLLHALAGRVESPLLSWHAAVSPPANLSEPVALRAPPRRSAAMGEQQLPFARLFPSIGVAAMHSSLAAPERVSVYFRSSRYGSFNHAHADQNSFVVTKAGRPLAIDSGYYDYYRSQHFLGWYKQTQAHNAITFDGGQGQAIGSQGYGEMSATGRITAFQSAASWDAVTGDAAAAYGAPVQRALRTLAFVRPGTLVVVDRLAASRPLRWEWNLHTADLRFAMSMASANGIGLTDEQRGLCVDVQADAPLAGTTFTDFPVPASGRPAGDPTQYHTRLSLVSPHSETRFVAVLRVDCAGAAPVMLREAGRIRVYVAGRVLDFDATGVAVQ